MRGSTAPKSPRFLSEAADDYEQALREQDRAASRNDAGGSHPGRTSRSGAEPAQHPADGAEAGRRHQGRRPAGERSRIVREAAARADLLLQKAQARLEDVQREIDGLRMTRRRSRPASRADDYPRQHAGVTCASRTGATGTRRSCCGRGRASQQRRRGPSTSHSVRRPLETCGRTDAR